MLKKTLFLFSIVSTGLFLVLLSGELLIRLTSKVEIRYFFKNWYEPSNKPGPPGPYMASSIIGLGYEIIPDACPLKRGRA